MSAPNSHTDAKDDPRRQDIGFDLWIEYRTAAATIYQPQHDNLILYDREQLRQAWICGAESVVSERGTISQELDAAMLECDDFLNNAPQYEDQLRVRDYRHEAYPKWARVVTLLRKSAPTPKGNDRLMRKIEDALNEVRWYRRKISEDENHWPDAFHKDVEAVASLVKDTAALLNEAYGALEAFTDPEDNMPQDTGEFRELKHVMVKLREFQRNDG